MRYTQNGAGEKKKGVIPVEKSEGKHYSSMVSQQPVPRRLSLLFSLFNNVNRTVSKLYLWILLNNKNLPVESISTGDWTLGGIQFSLKCFVGCKGISCGWIVQPQLRFSVSKGNVFCLSWNFPHSKKFCFINNLEAEKMSAKICQLI